VTGDLSVRPHLVLVVAIPRPPHARCRLEAQRRRNTVQDLRRKRPAKAEQHASLVGIDLWRRLPCGHADHHLRRHMREDCSDHSNASAQPADSTGQGDVTPTQHVGGGLHAPGRSGHRDAVVNRGEQARQPNGKEVRQQAERSVSLRAVPPSNPHASWRHPGVTAMTRK
jgi:hypothetical protein